MRIALPTRRSSAREVSQGLEIVVPAQRNVFLMLFLGAWLGGWFMGEISAARALFLGSAMEAKWFLAFWLTGWTVGGGFAIYMWLWMLAGKQRVLLRPDALMIRREVFGFGLIREYDLAHITNLRVAPSVSDPWSSGMRFWGGGAGPVAFDYGAKTFRFGDSLDEAEATQVVKELTARHVFRGAA